MSKARSALSSAARRRNERRFAESVRQHQRGQLDAAVRGYELILASDAQHVGALHYLALIRRQFGDMPQALTLLERATSARDADASVWNSLGSLLRESGRLEEAVQALRRCVELDPEHANGRFNLGLALLDTGDSAGAVQALAPVARERGRDGAVWRAYASALSGSGATDDALAAWRRAAQLVDGELEVELGLIHALADVHDLAAARERLVRVSVGRDFNAGQARALGQVWLRVADYREAAASLRKALAADPHDIDVREMLIRALTEAGDFEQAITLAREGLSAAPGSDALSLALGVTLLRANQVEAAIEQFQQLCERQPDWVEPVNNLAVAYAELGRMDEAVVLFRKAISMAPGAPEAWFQLVRSGSSLSDAEVSQLETLLARATFAPEQAVTLRFAVAQAYHSRARYDEAFAQYTAANALRRALLPFDAERYRAWMQTFHDVFTREFFERFAASGNPSKRPVFVLGMPRSGTSLVEQILASHPQVHGAGEIPDLGDLARSIASAEGHAFPASAAHMTDADAQRLATSYLERLTMLSNGAARVTDKTPSNFHHIGLIAVLFPNARIFHCVRDPLDVCFSNFTTHFASDHAYSNELADLALYYNEYVRLMAHWNAVLPGRIHDVSYEELVNETESVSRNMLSVLDLPWDDACLRFYETRRAVKTASDWQVRRPIYTTSTARWRHYQAHLDALAEAIGYRMEEPA